LKNQEFSEAQRPFEQSTDGDFFEDPSFSEVMFLHLMSNYIPVARWPLILGVHGPPGHGKSFQIESLARIWNIKAAFVSGSELESDRAGEPAEIIRQHYRDLGQFMHEQGKPAALVIDDIDAGIGDFGERVTYTVNRQNLSSALMNLCDRPEMLTSRAVRRVPIIVTANNIDSLYEPLRRPSRMLKLHWVAKGDVLKSIVGRIFSQIAEKATTDRLVDHLPTESPAFFQQVASMFMADQIKSAVGQQRKQQALRHAVLNPTTLNQAIQQANASQGSTLERLIHIADQVKG